MWTIRQPQPVEPEPRPPWPADDYPLGTEAERMNGATWVVEWDNQDKRHMWVKKEG